MNPQHFGITCEKVGIPKYVADEFESYADDPATLRVAYCSSHEFWKLAISAAENDKDALIRLFQILGAAGDDLPKRKNTVRLEKNDEIANACKHLIKLIKADPKYHELTLWHVLESSSDGTSTSRLKQSIQTINQGIPEENTIEYDETLTACIEAGMPKSQAIDYLEHLRSTNGTANPEPHIVDFLEALEHGYKKGFKYSDDRRPHPLLPLNNPANIRQLLVNEIYEWFVKHTGNYPKPKSVVETANAIIDNKVNEKTVIDDKYRNTMSKQARRQVPLSR